MRITCLFFLLFCLLNAFTSLHSTHIVGGQMTYTHVVDNTYRVRCEVIRDCFYADPTVYFDDPAYFGIFDENNMLIENISAEFMGIDDTFTNGVIGDLCVYSEEICFHRTAYEFEVALPETGLYTVAYQRCCRSERISNILDPFATGMTFRVRIDAELQNNSAEFGPDFPVTVYVGTPFIFDGGGTDPDGDSLVYSLATPLSGGTFSAPQPIPTNPPPYDTVNYAAGYSLDNMLGGPYPLSIDSATGQLSAIPVSRGVFQIGYQISEYREGVLLGSVYREFVFNVTLPQPDLSFTVSGAVSTEQNILLDQGYVELQERDLLTDLFSVLQVDTLEETDNGQYNLSNIQPGVTYLKAFPDTVSEVFNTHLPTYLGGTLLWYEADPVDQCDTNQVNRDISLIPLADNSGDITASLVVLDDTDGLNPVVGLRLFLFNEDGQPLAHSQTDENGLITFGQFATGHYFIKIDSINSPYLNETEIILGLAPGVSNVGYLYESSMEIIMVTSLIEDDLNRSKEILLYPNPTNGRFQLELKNNLLIQSVSIFSFDGRRVFTSPVTDLSNRLQLDISGYPRGAYLVNVIDRLGNLYSVNLLLE